jgi:hypothetical protein
MKKDAAPMRHMTIMKQSCMKRLLGVAAIAFSLAGCMDIKLEAEFNDDRSARLSSTIAIKAALWNHLSPAQRPPTCRNAELGIGKDAFASDVSEEGEWIQCRAALFIADIDRPNDQILRRAEDMFLKVTRTGANEVAIQVDFSVKENQRLSEADAAMFGSGKMDVYVRGAPITHTNAPMRAAREARITFPMAQMLVGRPPVSMFEAVVEPPRRGWWARPFG